VPDLKKKRKRKKKEEEEIKNCKPNPCHNILDKNIFYSCISTVFDMSLRHIK